MFAVEPRPLRNVCPPVEVVLVSDEECEVSDDTVLGVAGQEFLN